MKWKLNLSNFYKSHRYIYVIQSWIIQTRMILQLVIYFIFLRTHIFIFIGINSWNLENIKSFVKTLKTRFLAEVSHPSNSFNRNSRKIDAYKSFKIQNPDQEMQQDSKSDLEGGGRGKAKGQRNKFSGDTEATSRWSVSFSSF